MVPEGKEKELGVEQFKPFVPYTLQDGEVFHVATVRCRLVVIPDNESEESEEEEEE